MTLKKRIIFKYVPIGIGISIAGLIIGLVFMDWVIMPLVVGKHRGYAVVPNIVGMTPRQAGKIIRKAGLKMKKTEDEYSDSIPSGSICTQLIKFNKEVKKGRTVGYVLSMGPVYYEIPELRDKTLRQAKINIRTLNLKIGDIKYIFDDSIPPEHVVYTLPEAGTTVSRDTVVNFFVSQGVEPEESYVPNLVGMPFKKGAYNIKKAALTLGKVRYVLKKELLPNTIISQSLTPGSNVKRGLKINLVVSKNEED